MRIDTDAQRAQPARRGDQPVGEGAAHVSLTRQSTLTIACLVPQSVGLTHKG